MKPSLRELLYIRDNYAELVNEAAHIITALRAGDMEKARMHGAFAEGHCEALDFILNDLIRSYDT